MTTSVTLEAISQGKSGTGKNGKPYQLIGIKTTEHGDEWMNGFGSDITTQWKKGDKVSIIIYEEDYNGKTYKKFKLPNASAALEERVAKLEDQVKFLAKKVGITSSAPLKEEPLPVIGDNGDDPFDSIDFNSADKEIQY